jgi:hypothetical protein
MVPLEQVKNVVKAKKTTGAYMASVNSVDGQTIWYILDDITQYLGYYRNILAVIGNI